MPVLSNYMFVRGMMFFKYLSQNNILQKFQYRSRYEIPAVFYHQTLKIFAKENRLVDTVREGESGKN